MLKVSFSFHVPSYLTTATTPSTAVKVVLPDGKVHQFDQPLTVAELMLDHPQRVVVEFEPELVTMTTARGRKVVPLPADKKLETNKIYLMLPFKRGKPLSLSSEEARRAIVSANIAFRQSTTSSASKFVPLFSKMCTASVGEGDCRGGDFVSPVSKRDLEVKKVTNGKKRLFVFFEEEDEDEEMLLESKVGGTAEYLSRQLSGKGWKPSLDTIKEKKVEQHKLQHWLF